MNKNNYVIRNKGIYLYKVQINGLLFIRFKVTYYYVNWHY